MLKNKYTLSQIKKVIPWLLLFGIAFFIYFGEKIKDQESGDIELFPKEKISEIEKSSGDEVSDEAEELNEKDNKVLEDNVIFIDVSGAVHKPSVVQLTEGSRVFEAIELAGGINEEADTKNINLAQTLKDGEKIYIQTKEEALSGTKVESKIHTNKEGGDGENKINLNRADSMELQKLKGVGPSTAERILAYREQYGAFKSIEELKNVSGIGEKTFEKLKNYIYIE
ncbi:helix-hairpin-helix domain-containing protein [Sinanaerobacter sp. ZZT-01]|uniref:helix-hairpin-helix domain-containing protein n=1 Tax=Sinanaerobacter sp. ZZT-01 TaxID=3111540 RepID=UPI002D76914B|nr:helix-hairpin-helix domain-containing protein [Sinanaerobacter sp. ZZT-01]WRR93086.1 helix-hairpin-helix domain-containing protein [Sinanaerobacter sp. ZZT-01]